MDIGPDETVSDDHLGAVVDVTRMLPVQLMLIVLSWFACGFLTAGKSWQSGVT